MNLGTKISLRYLFGKTSANAIHWITGITILGLTLGSASLILVLSVFNGFEDLLSGLFSKHNPDIKIVSKTGAYFEEDSFFIQKIKQIPEVKSIGRSLEKTAMFQYGEAQDFGIVKGIDTNCISIFALDSAIVEGVSDLNQTHHAIIALGVFNKLGIDLQDPLQELYVFSPGSKLKEISLHKSISRLQLRPEGAFSFHQESDNELVLCPLQTLRNYIGDSMNLSSLNIELHKGSSASANAVKQIKTLAGDLYIVKDRAKQDETFLKIMKLEKWLFFALFSLTLLLVSFTLVGAVWMIVLDKRRDISILKSLGMYNHQVQRSFVRLGLMISSIGLFIGFLISIVFYFLQKKYKLIGVPEEFIIDSYPMELRAMDFVIVGITVMLISYLASLIPTYKISEFKPIFREE